MSCFCVSVLLLFFSIYCMLCLSARGSSVRAAGQEKAHGMGVGTGTRIRGREGIGNGMDRVRRDGTGREGFALFHSGAGAGGDDRDHQARAQTCPGRFGPVITSRKSLSGDNLMHYRGLGVPDFAHIASYVFLFSSSSSSSSLFPVHK